MKTLAVFVLAFIAPGVALAQNPDPSKWMCRNLSDSGGFLYEGETIFGSSACRPVPQAAPQTQLTAGATAPVPTPSNQPALAARPEQPQESPAPPAPAASTRPPRIFLQAASHGNTWNARRDQSMEMSKDFEKVCPDVKITINQQAADYTVILNHIEIGLLARDNQIQVADKDGDLLKTSEGGGIKGDVKKACNLILEDWPKQQPNSRVSDVAEKQ